MLNLARSGGERIALHRPDRDPDPSLAQEVRRRHVEADGEPVAGDRRTGGTGDADSPALDPRRVGVKSEIGLDPIVPGENVEQPLCEAKRVADLVHGRMDDAFQANGAGQRRLDRQGLLWAERVLNGAVAALQGPRLACDGKRGATVEEVHLSRNLVPEVELVPFGQSVHREAGFEGKREAGPGVAAEAGAGAVAHEPQSPFEIGRINRRVDAERRIAAQSELGRFFGMAGLPNASA